MTAYWIAVASREHVLGGVNGGFCQVCHGKAGPLRLMKEGDWVAYYSPVEVFGGAVPCRKFTAIGRIRERQPYQYQMGEGFVPWRRDVLFVPCREAPIVPLIHELEFIHDKERWGFPFRRGCFKVGGGDFGKIANHMGVTLF